MLFLAFAIFFTFCEVGCCGAVINGFQESLGSPTGGASFWMHCHMWTWMGMGMGTRTQLGNVNDAECWLSGCSFSSDSNFHLSLSSKIQRHTVAVIVDVHRRPKVPAATICIFGPEPRLHLSQSSRNEAPLRPHLPATYTIQHPHLIFIANFHFEHLHDSHWWWEYNPSTVNNWWGFFSSFFFWFILGFFYKLNLLP